MAFMDQANRHFMMILLTADKSSVIEDHERKEVRKHFQQGEFSSSQEI